MNPTRIDWPRLTHTWNPVTGCIRGCSYCYAKKIHQRFNKNLPFSVVTFHAHRLNESVPQSADRIFVGSMSDFEFWKPAWVSRIVDYCREHQENEFMFLSKSTRGYLYMDSIGMSWPSNTMQGLTIEKCDTELEIEKVKDLAFIVPRPFISYEPILGPCLHCIPEKIELVIVGAMTGLRATPAQECWVRSISECVTLDTKVHYKNTIPKKWM